MQVVAAKLRDAETKLVTAREALEWYANGHREESDCNALGVDDGALAAEALAKLDGGA